MKELMPDVHKTFHHFTGMVGFWSVGGGSRGSLSFKPWVLKTGCWFKQISPGYPSKRVNPLGGVTYLFLEASIGLRLMNTLMIVSKYVEIAAATPPIGM